MDLHLDVISKLRCDANLRYVYSIKALSLGRLVLVQWVKNDKPRESTPRFFLMPSLAL
ncbi:MAG: hypothetical protein ACK53E_24550 [Pseudanabaena sp.]